jgi:hypothetical protein
MADHSPGLEQKPQWGLVLWGLGFMIMGYLYLIQFWTIFFFQFSSVFEGSCHNGLLSGSHTLEAHHQWSTFRFMYSPNTSLMVHIQVHVLSKDHHGVTGEYVNPFTSLNRINKHTFIMYYPFTSLNRVNKHTFIMYNTSPMVHGQVHVLSKHITNGSRSGSDKSFQWFMYFV